MFITFCILMNIHYVLTNDFEISKYYVTMKIIIRRPDVHSLSLRFFLIIQPLVEGKRTVLRLSFIRSFQLIMFSVKSGFDHCILAVKSSVLLIWLWESNFAIQIKRKSISDKLESTSEINVHHNWDKKIILKKIYIYKQ